MSKEEDKNLKKEDKKKENKKYADYDDKITKKLDELLKYHSENGFDNTYVDKSRESVNTIVGAVDYATIAIQYAINKMMSSTDILDNMLTNMDRKSIQGRMYKGSLVEDNHVLIHSMKDFDIEFFLKFSGINGVVLDAVTKDNLFDKTSVTLTKYDADNPQLTSPITLPAWLFMLLSVYAIEGVKSNEMRKMIVDRYKKLGVEPPKAIRTDFKKQLGLDKGLHPIVQGYVREGCEIINVIEQDNHKGVFLIRPEENSEGHIVGVNLMTVYYQTIKTKKGVNIVTTYRWTHTDSSTVMPKEVFKGGMRLLQEEEKKFIELKDKGKI